MDTSRCGAEEGHVAAWDFTGVTSGRPDAYRRYSGIVAAGDRAFRIGGSR
jgi:hypothetical protein